jgi:DNA primase
VDPKVKEAYEERRRKEDLSVAEAKKRHLLLEDKKLGPPVRGYFEGRGFGTKLQERFMLGSTSDGRPSIPFWHSGRVHGNIIRNPDDTTPKYRYPNKEKMPLGRKPLLLLDHPRPVEYVVVEGIFDTLAAAALGIPVIGTGGAGASAEQIEDLKHLGQKGASFVIIPDGDERGIAAARDTAEKLYPFAKLTPPLPQPYKDLARMYEDLGAAAKDECDFLLPQATDAVERWMCEMPKHPRDKVKHLKKHIVPLLLQIPSEAERQVVIKEIAKADGLTMEIVRQAIVEQQAAIMVTPREDPVEDIPESEWKHLLEPGVAARYTEAVCEMRAVVGERDKQAVTVVLLSMVGAQLDLLPTNVPMGSSIMLTGPSGRGKNYIADAATTAAPPEWYRAFTHASAQAFYWAAQEDPSFLTHKFLYPNEAEATDLVVEFLRPMLSQGRAKKYVTDKEETGAFTFTTIDVEGPVTGAIPTVRNVLNDQLQNRLLVVGLEDYAGGAHKGTDTGTLQPLYPGETRG